MATDADADNDIDTVAVIAKLASGSDATLPTAMTYMIVCNDGGFATDVATLADAADAVTPGGTAIADTTTLSSGELFDSQLL